MKKIILLALFSISLIGCQSKVEEAATKEEIAKKPISEMSIYNLPEQWTTQNGNDIELKELRGKVLVMVMIYTSCKAACPRLVADMRNIEKKVPQDLKDKIQYILISIDPETDTPERLKAFAIENQMDNNQWLFLRSNDEQTREFSAVLAVNYKKISPLDFSHSNIISVFNAEGELAFQQEGLGVNNDKIISTIKEEAAKVN
ncbi:SCO family protein [Flavobacterium tegetincola]|uniref:SCO family protein n=1 Tax=Flavobacterium tegetincola TaxID=150172 RepID=UPI000425499D|nr:SCO family protein [Flavobacterium tegetincola]